MKAIISKAARRKWAWVLALVMVVSIVIPTSLLTVTVPTSAFTVRSDDRCWNSKIY